MKSNLRVRGLVAGGGLLKQVKNLDENEFLRISFDGIKF